MKNKEQRRQYNIKNDIPFDVTMGSSVFKVRYLKSWTSDRISKELIEADMVDVKNVFNSIKSNGSLPAKVASLMILNSYWKIRLFHPFFWRWIYRNKTHGDILETITIMTETLDLSSFITSIHLTSQMNAMKKKVTQREVKQLLAEHQ